MTRKDELIEELWDLPQCDTADEPEGYQRFIRLLEEYALIAFKERIEKAEFSNICREKISGVEMEEKIKKKLIGVE